MPDHAPGLTGFKIQTCPVDRSHWEYPHPEHLTGFGPLATLMSESLAGNHDFGETTFLVPPGARACTEAVRQDFRQAEVFLRRRKPAYFDFELNTRSTTAVMPEAVVTWMLRDHNARQSHLRVKPCSRSSASRARRPADR